MAEPVFPPQLALFLRSLASESRQAILTLFARGDALTVGEVAARAGVAQSTASEQLGILRDGGLLVATRVGKEVRYRGDTASVRSRLAELTELLDRCCPPG